MSEKLKNVLITIITLIVIILVIVGIILIQKKSNDSIKENIKAQKSSEKKEEENQNSESEEDLSIDKIDYEKVAEEQMAKPQKGETIAILHVKDKGDIKIKFFKEEAPKAVENFITHSKNGYYNGLTFHRVINDFVIQGGDPTGTGTGGQSIWNEPFKKEVSLNRFPFRGTLCMASVPGVEASIGSQFFITQAQVNAKSKLDIESQLKSASLTKAYSKYGGVPSLFLGYTVLGQVYEGLDVVDNIAKVETNAQDKPIEDVIIEKIDILEAE